MLALLAYWAVPFTRAQGGRGVHHELVFALLLIPLLAALRVWRVPSASALAAAVVALCALLVCVFAPSGWWGSDVAAEYVISAAVYIGERGYARDSERRTVVAVAICMACLYQFSQAFTAWRGSGDPGSEMSGTFYWHNPYAAFLFPGAVIGLALVAQSKAPWSIAGWVSVPLCGAGIVFSSSRATMAVLAAGWLVVLVGCLRTRAAALRAFGALLLAAAVVLLLPGPPFFPHRSSPFASTTARSDTGQSLAQNGAYRTEFWREAGEVALHRPLVGSGYHTLATASAYYTPGNWARSPLAHDGFLQAFSDGGLLLGVPVLLVAALSAFWALRRFLALLFRRSGTEHDLLMLAFATAFLGGLAHSAVDFDWSHASIMVEAAVLAACLAPTTEPSVRRLGSYARGASLLALVGLLGVLGVALHQWQRNQLNLTRSTVTILSRSEQTFGDFRGPAGVLREIVGGSRSPSLEQERRLLALTSPEASVDLHLSLLRDAVGAKAGLMPDAVAKAEQTLRTVGAPALGPYVVDLAHVEIAAGDKPALRATLQTEFARQAGLDTASPITALELDIWASELGKGSGYACQVDAFRRLSGNVSTVPAPVGSCSAS